MARTLPAGLAALVEGLELDQATVVTLAMIAEIADREHLGTPAKVLAARLRERGWLLPTTQRGVYEFAPGAHAGAYGRGETTLGLQAALRAHPEIGAALTLQSAAWAHGVADRSPSRLEIAAGSRADVRLLVRAGRVIVFAPALPPVVHHSVPVLGPASVLAHMAAHPGHVRSWAGALEWFPDLASLAELDDVVAEASALTVAGRARLGYVLSGVRPDVVERIGSAGTSTTYLGPRGRGSALRHDSRWQVVDSLLPFDPRELPSVVPDEPVASGSGRRLVGGARP